MKIETTIRKFNHQSGKNIDIHGAQIYVEEIGHKSAFPLVFLHGGFGSIQDFNPLLDKIEGNFRFIGIDTRGHGRSTLGNESLSYELLQNDVENILEQLGISKCYLVGFSDGGITAYHLAIKNPSLVLKIVTIGADWCPPNLDLQARFLALTTESWKKRFPESVELYNSLNPQANFEILMKKVITMWLNPSGYPQERLKEIRSELLIIRGDEDHLMPRSSTTTLSEYLPAAKLLNIPFAGHAAHADQSEIVGKILKQFF